VNAGRDSLDNGSEAGRELWSLAMDFWSTAELRSAGKAWTKLPPAAVEGESLPMIAVCLLMGCGGDAKLKAGRGTIDIRARTCPSYLKRGRPMLFRLDSDVGTWSWTMIPVSPFSYGKDGLDGKQDSSKRSCDPRRVPPGQTRSPDGTASPCAHLRPPVHAAETRRIPNFCMKRW
jgi:hypothetical protein